jgi:hypothetical protein
MAYLLQGSAAPVNPTFTGNNNNWAVAIAAFVPIFNVRGGLGVQFRAR